MVNRKNNLVISLLNFLLLIVGIVVSSEKLLLICQMFSIVIIMYKVRKNNILLLISMFFAMYVVPPYLHYFHNVQLSAYITYNNDACYYRVLLCQVVFFFIFSTLLNDVDISESSNKFHVETYYSPSAFWLCVVGVIGTIMIGRGGDTIFSRGGYGIRGTSTGSALFEYCYIFYILAYVFSGNKKNNKVILIFLFLIYSLRALLYGARIEILALMILVYILYYQNRLKNHTTIILAVVAYFLFSIFGSFRANLDFSYGGFWETYGYNTQSNRIVNNESEVFYTSSVILASITTGFVDIKYRIGALINYLIRFVVPSSLFDQKYNVVPYLQQHFSPCGGGGFFSAFLYFYGGWIGVFLGAFVIAKFWNKIMKINLQNTNWQIFTVMTLVMTPRWFAYSPESIVKIPLYSCIGYVLLRTFFLKTTVKGSEKCRK